LWVNHMVDQCAFITDADVYDKITMHIFKCPHSNRDTTDCPHGFKCVHGDCALQEVNSTSEYGSLRFRCNCDAGWSGDHCDQCCLSQCDRGVCEIRGSEEACRCQWGYIGEFCNETKHLFPGLEGSSPGAQLAALLVCSILGVLLLTLLVVLPIYLWKRRGPIVMKISDKMNCASSKNNKEKYLYDVFISYDDKCDLDDTWVVEKLWPKLEKDMELRLCIHLRDFEIGAAKSDNILKAVTSSRRTLLILTPEFLQGEWTRFEYLVAQHQMLRLKHQIVPLILRPLPKAVLDEEKNVAHLLNTTTCLHYPGTEDAKREKTFWKKLQKHLTR